MEIYSSIPADIQDITALIPYSDDSNVNINLVPQNTEYIPENTLKIRENIHNNNSVPINHLESNIEEKNGNDIEKEELIQEKDVEIEIEPKIPTVMKSENMIETFSENNREIITEVELEVEDIIDTKSKKKQKEELSKALIPNKEPEFGKEKFIPKAQDVTEEIVQKFIDDKEHYLEISLFQEQISHLDINYFFSKEYSSKYLLETYPKIKEVYQVYVPAKLNPYTFWMKFMYFVYDEYEKKDSEVVKVDYHSLNRYIVSAILSFVKVFFVIMILHHYEAPTFLYLYPAIWFIFGILIILRAMQIQKKNNIIAAKLKEEGIELKEMESV